nr:uncharacterized protein LOC104108225 [Nicotiana tomentosiformis]
MVRGNPGPSSYDFCVRNYTEDVVCAMEEEIGISTNIVAEARAIVEGLLYCVQRQLHPLIIETNSLVMKKIIEGEWEIHWNIGKEVKKIKEIKENYNVIFQHVLRKGNTVSDFLANLVFSFAGTIQFYSFSEMPSAGRRLINFDKSQIPNLRVRVAKRIAPD